MQLRRSSRLQNAKDGSSGKTLPSSTKRKGSKSVSIKASAKNKATTKARNKKMDCLPRTREEELRSTLVMGIDEAGRGPLAGPVVAAAAMVPVNVSGVLDSKRLTKESHREEVFDRLMKSTGIRWAVAIVDAPTIDEVNILQATLRAMRMAASCLLRPEQASPNHEGNHNVVVGGDTSVFLDPKQAHALIDGNQVPPDMPCEAEAMVKGDGREYLIGAASIIAKVTRDRLMRQYDEEYPEYQLSKHKGYPTALHIELIKQHGASPIHRRTFAPLKHMTFDQKGKILSK